MFKFIRKILYILVFITGLTFLLLFFSTSPKYGPLITKVTNSTDYAEGYNMGPSEIIPYIDKVRTKDQTTRLILGDSVCFRMFSELQDLNPDWCIAGSNRGVTMSGQYILLQEYLKNHPNATDVYLIILEDSLITTYETGYGYQYAVMPFLMTNTLDQLEPSTIKEMKKTYGSFMINKKSAEFISNSPFGKKLYLNLLNRIAPVSSTLEISHAADLYIPKMYDLCQKNKVTLHLIASPLADSPKRHELESTIKSNYENSAIYSYFPDYFNQVLYYPENYFSDGIHPSVDRTTINDMIRSMQQISDTMYDLILE